MTKSQLCLRLCAMHPNMLKKDMRKIIDVLIFEIIESISRNELVQIRSFGCFSAKKQKEYIGRNPRTQKRVLVKQKLSVRWKCSKLLLRQLNKNITENKISA